MAAEPDPPHDDASAQDAVLRLNAMVDGELPAAERAALAARMAADRDLARAHATLARLKAAVAELGEAPAALPSVPGTGRPWRRLGVGAGAAAGAAAVLTLAFLHTVPPEAEPVASEPAHAVIRVAGLPADPVVPDLAPAGLKLAGIAMETAGVVATYHGPRGCRLELRVFEAGAAPAAPPGTDRRTWTAGGLTYELVAFGMPAARFAAVAAAAEQAVRGRPADAPAWREARAGGVPCTAG